MVYGRCQRDRRLCCRFHADRGTPLLGGCSCCHSKLSYDTGLLRLLSVTGRCRLAVTSPTSSRIRKRLRTATSFWVPAASPIPVRVALHTWDRATIPMDRVERSERCARFTTTGCASAH